MKCESNFYLTSDRLLDIEFLFVDMGRSTGWRAYILTNIDYKMCYFLRSDSCTVVHRLTEHDSGMTEKINRFIRESRGTNEAMRTIQYICWNKPIHSLSDMKTVAKTWSEITAYYIRHGGSFETIQPVLRERGIISI